MRPFLRVRSMASSRRFQRAALIGGVGAAVAEVDGVDADADVGEAERAHELEVVGGDPGGGVLRRVVAPAAEPAGGVDAAGERGGAAEGGGAGRRVCLRRRGEGEHAECGDRERAKEGHRRRVYRESALIHDAESQIGLRDCYDLVSWIFNERDPAVAILIGSAEGSKFHVHFEVRAITADVGAL